jgi:quercetin dioxygenase-like cupin family protein
METHGKFWGKTSPLFNKNNVEIHRIEAIKGGFCSEHSHAHKFNMFFVESGALKITEWKDPSGNPDETVIHAGDTCSVPPGIVHKFEAVEDTIAFEVYWVSIEESDIERRKSGGSK